MNQAGFDYSLFNEYDREIIKALIEAGEMDKIPNAIIVQDQKQEREIAILLSAKPKPAIFEESKVRQEMIDLQTKDNLPIITNPKEEAAWQKKLDEEKAIQQKRIDEQKQKEIAALETAVKPKNKADLAVKTEAKVIETQIDSKLVLA